MNHDLEMPLIEIKTINNRILLDIRYATENNFTGHRVYSVEHCYVLPIVAEKLSRIQNKLEALGLGLKIYDAFRPKSAQLKFWELVPDERYIANPAKGSRHTRGTTVDVTLVDKEGQELEMPTPFDDFSESAHRNNMECSTTAIQNRALLERMMVEEDFEPLPTEWWHFDLKDWRSYPELDLEF